MIQQLIWIEALLKGVVGVLLLAAPLLLIRLLGLPRLEHGLWPRLLGAALLGLAGAYLIEGLLDGRARGLGMAGSVAVNLTGAMTLAALPVLSTLPLARRGRIALWASASVLALLGFVEIAYAAVR